MTLSVVATIQFPLSLNAISSSSGLALIEAPETTSVLELAVSLLLELLSVLSDEQALSKTRAKSCRQNSGEYFRHFHENPSKNLFISSFIITDSKEMSNHTLKD